MARSTDCTKLLLRFVVSIFVVYTGRCISTRSALVCCFQRRLLVFIPSPLPLSEVCHRPPLKRATPAEFGTPAYTCAPEKQRRSPGSMTSRNSEAVSTGSLGSGTKGALDLPERISSRCRTALVFFNGFFQYSP